MIDASKVTLIDNFECNSCGFKELFARSLNDEPTMICPSCKSRNIYVRIEFGRDDNEPAKPSVRTRKSPYDDYSIEQLAELLDTEGEEWKDGVEPEFGEYGDDSEFPQDAYSQADEEPLIFGFDDAGLYDEDFGVPDFGNLDTGLAEDDDFGGGDFNFDFPNW